MLWGVVAMLFAAFDDPDLIAHAGLVPTIRLAEHYPFGFEPTPTFVTNYAIYPFVGLIEPASGMITFAGQRIEGRDPHRISELGIAYGPEGGGLFRDLTVRDNLEMGAYHRVAWEHRESSLRRVFRLFPRLEERERALARTLSGGERQMLVIGRALMARPTLCILDEPSIGLAPRLVEEAFDAIEQIRDEGITVLLIEQSVRRSLAIADRAYVMESGRMVLEGDRETLLQEDLIRKAYLGL